MELETQSSCYLCETGRYGLDENASWHYNHAKKFRAKVSCPLDPPPVCENHNISKYFPGLTKIDEPLAPFSMKELLQAGHSQKGVVFESQEGETLPPWADPEALERAQKLFLDNAALFIMALSKALTSGFCLPRLSKVLVLSGYASSPKATLIRFNSTTVSIVEWMLGDLADSSSVSRKSILRVRCFHESARRTCHSRWDEEKDGKIPGEALSLYDMSLVQLAFSGILFNILDNDIGLSLNKQEKEDQLHLWKVIGHFLGIPEEQNVCRSMDDTIQITNEIIQLTPFFTTQPPKDCLFLANSYIDGLGIAFGNRLSTEMNFRTTRTWYDDSWASSFITPSPVADLILRSMYRILTYDNRMRCELEKEGKELGKKTFFPFTSIRRLVNFLILRNIFLLQKHARSPFFMRLLRFRGYFIDFFMLCLDTLSFPIFLFFRVMIFLKSLLFQKEEQKLV